MSKVYCQDAAAAEITFSLTGGREGKIISYNPPIVVNDFEYPQRVVCHGVNSVIFDVVVSGNWELFPGVPINNAIYIIVYSKGFTPGVSLQFIPYTSYLAYFPVLNLSTNIQEQSHQILRKLDSGILEYDHGAIYYSPFRQFRSILLGNEKSFVIQDKKEVLYSFSYLDPPTYQVKCLSCPEGLCPVKTREGIKCFNCKRVLAGLGRISSNLDEIL
jgi:hypothetical protein